MLQKIKSDDRIYGILRILFALLLALVFGGIMFSASGYKPLQVYTLIFQGAFGSWKAFLTTLTYAAPLLLSGLAFAIAAKANIMNLGGEGQIYVGAMTAAIVGAYVTFLPRAAHLPLTLLVSFVVAGLYGALAAFLRVRFGSNEVIVTIMLNYLAQKFCSYLVSYPLQDSLGVPQTKQIMATARLGRMFEGHHLSSILLIALVAIAIAWFVMSKTHLGYQMKVLGFNMKAAETAGIDYKKLMIVTMFLSAGVAGLCGAGQVLGTHFRFIDNFSSGYGFEGIAVAALAGNNPLLLIFSGLLFGGIKAGAAEVNRVASLPMDYVLLIQAMVVVLIASPKLMDAILSPLRKLTKARREKACHS